MLRVLIVGCYGIHLERKLCDDVELGVTFRVTERRA
jgi:hypothetical protein